MQQPPSNQGLPQQPQGRQSPPTQSLPGAQYPPPQQQWGQPPSQQQWTQYPQQQMSPQSQQLYPQQQYYPQQQMPPQYPQWQQPSRQQYYPQQQPPQQWQQPPQPPQKPFYRTPFGIICGVLVVFLLLCATVVTISQAAQSTSNTGTAVTSSSNTGVSSTADASSNTDATSVPTSAPPAPPPPQQHFAIGQMVLVGNTWQIAVLSAKTSTGSMYVHPQHPGDVFLILIVSMKNLSNQEQRVSGLIQFDVSDQDGQKYNFAFDPDAGPTLGGKVEAGSPIKGSLVYEIPTSLHQVQLSFQANLIESGQAIWDIKV
jgi:hypothetical protein